MTLRILTAIALLAIFVPAIVWAPAWLWLALVALVVAVAAHEWARMARFSNWQARGYALLLGGLAVLLGDGGAYRVGVLGVSVVFWLVVAPAWLMWGWRLELRGLRALVGAVLLLPTAVALVVLHRQGAGMLVGVFAVVWIADTAAYFAGRQFGRHKLAPSISPGKTREGVAGALVALAVYAAALSSSLDWPLMSLFAALTGLLYFSVLGDLFESWIKRVAGMKDSGTLLPGHGGVLDRVDALTAVLPLAAAWLIWLERAA